MIAREGAEKPLRCGVWHHVAFVADGAMLRLYHNGVEVAATPYRGIHRPALPKALGIGCQVPDLGSGHEPGNPGLSGGRIDEVAVFNHPLTAEQVWQLYTGSATAVRPITVKPAANNNPSGSRNLGRGERRKRQAITGAESGRSQSDADLRKRGEGRYGLSCVW